MDLPNRLLKLLVALFIVLQHAHAERLQWFNDFVSENAKGLGRLGGD